MPEIHTEQCRVSNVVLAHSLDEMAIVAYQLREMYIRVDQGWEETQLVYNHIKSALGMEKGDVDYVKAYEDHMDEIKFQFDQEDLASENSLKNKSGWDEEDGGGCRVHQSGRTGRMNRIQAQARIQGCQ